MGTHTTSLAPQPGSPRVHSLGFAWLWALKWDFSSPAELGCKQACSRLPGTFISLKADPAAVPHTALPAHSQPHAAPPASRLPAAQPGPPRLQASGAGRQSQGALLALEEKQKYPRHSTGSLSKYCELRSSNACSRPNKLTRSRREKKGRTVSLRPSGLLCPHWGHPAKAFAAQTRGLCGNCWAPLHTEILSEGSNAACRSM